MADNLVDDARYRPRVRFLRALPSPSTSCVFIILIVAVLSLFGCAPGNTGSETAIGALDTPAPGDQPPPPPNNVSYFTDPGPSQTETQLPDGRRAVVLHKELYGYPNYGVADGRSDILYTGESATWTFALPPSIAPAEVREATFRASLIADDHYGVGLDAYRLAAWTNADYRGEGQAGLPHGSPYGGQFSNWVQLDYAAAAEVSAYSISLLNTSGVGNWFAVDWIELRLVIGEPPPNPEITSIRPVRGGNVGRVTLTIRGGGFPNAPATVALVGGGGELTAAAQPSSSAGYTATIDLSSGTPGLRDVVLRFAGGTAAVLPAAFEIVPGGGGQLEVALLGPSVARVNRLTTFLAVIRNTGLNDVGPIIVRTSVDSASSRPAANDGLLALSIGTPVAPTATATTLPSLPPGSTGVPFPVTIGECSKVKTNAEDPCATERERWLRLSRELDAVHNQLSAAGLEYAFNCRTPEQVTSPYCLALAAQIETLRLRQRFLADQVDAALADLEACENRNRGGGGSGGDPGSQGSGSGGVSAEQTICPVYSWDPNDKVGAAGVGPARYVSGRDPLPYTIFFENNAAATAPAQEVRVIDKLSLALDLDTLSFGVIRFGSRSVDVSAPTQEVDTVVDLRPERDLLVHVGARLDRSQRELQWRFTSLDPITNEPPTDPLAGFLPPNLTPPEGEGTVFYTIQPTVNAATGTQIRNQASIVFDTNEPIVTPEWLNTIDVTPPESSVAAIPDVQKRPTFNVSWSGSDPGAGVQDYTILVSEDGVSFAPWIENTRETSALFTGVRGKTYQFYSVARDLVGNSETVPDAPDATTTVAADVTPPTTQATLSRQPVNGWLTSDAQVVLNATDGPDGSGVAGITYWAAGAEAIAMTTVTGATVSIPITVDGDTTIGFSSTDLAGNVETANALTVRLDKMPPTLTCSVSPSVLWPPNGRLVTVTASIAVQDAGSGVAGFTLSSVTSDEPGGDQDIRQFQIGAPDVSGQLRAERLAKGDGRAYTLVYQAQDLAGNRSSCVLGVFVPHDEGKHGSSCATAPSSQH